MDSSDLLSSRRDRVKANNYNNLKATEYPNKMPRLSSQDLIDIKRGVQEVSLDDGTTVLPACGGPTCSEDVQAEGQWIVSTFFVDPTNYPRDIARDSNGNFYVVFSPNGTGAKIYKISSSGTLINSNFYTFVSDTAARGLTYYNGYIYFIDSDGGSGLYIYRKDVTTGITDMAFQAVTSITRAYLTAFNGYIYYGAANHAIYKVHESLSNPPILVAGVPNTLGFQDGTGLTAKFNNPNGMAIYNGILYVADSGNNRIRAIDLLTNNVSTFAGTGASSPNIYNLPNLSSTFYSPLDIAIDSLEGAMYVADFSHNQIKKIHNGIVTLFAGTTSGYVDGNTAAAKMGPIRGLFLIENNGPPTIYVSEEKHIRLIKYVV